jgi:thiamine-phosphate pyrophosphorylase
MPSVKALSDCRLYTFVDAAYLRGRRPEAVAQELCDGGSDLIQLRAKDVSTDDIRRLAEAILPVTRGAGVGLVINDHPEIAAEVGAEFCHLGQEYFFNLGYTRESEVTGGAAQIGLSTHAPEQAQRALAAKPAYIAIGPVYATDTKPTARPCNHTVVCHRRNQFDESRTGVGGGRAADLRGVGDFERAGCGGGVPGIPEDFGFLREGQIARFPYFTRPGSP